MPEFSVIIPTFNRAQMVTDAIESALAQSEAACEIIVIDDGSSDDTEAVLAGYGDKIRLIKQANAGPGAARNTGVAAASRDWIAFLDSDDVSLPHCLSTHAAIIAAVPDVDAIFGMAEVLRDGEPITDIYQDNPLWRRAFAKSQSLHTWILEKENEEDRALFVEHQFMHTCCVTIRRSLFDYLGGFPNEIRIGEDALLWLAVVISGAKVALSTQAIACVRVGSHVSFARGTIQSNKAVVQIPRWALAHNSGASPSLRHALRRRLFRARGDLAHVCLRERGRMSAVVAALPVLWESPGWPSLRLVLSLLMP